MILFTLIYWITIMTSLLIGFFFGYVKFVPESPEQIKKVLSQMRKKVEKRIEKKQEEEVGPVRPLTQEEKEERDNPEFKATEEIIKDKLLKASFSE